MLNDAIGSTGADPITPLRFGLAGTGIYLPRRAVDAAKIERLVNLPAGSSQTRFGIDQRFHAEPDETSSFMAAAAARDALAEAGWQPGDVDVLIGACGVMEQPIPDTALLVQQRLGLGDTGVPAFDVNATCLSFLVALDVLGQHRWTRRKVPRRADDEQRLTDDIIALARQYGRYGYRRVTALLRDAGRTPARTRPA